MTVTNAPPVAPPRAGPSIRVLLVDDSMVTLVSLKRILSAAPGIEVVGTATNGREALALIPELEPNVICTDLHMPVMDGLEFTRRVMEQYPRPVLVLSVSVQKDQTTNIFRLLDAGAIDVMAKPRGRAESVDARELVSKIRILAGVVTIRRRRESEKDAGQPRRPPVQASGKVQMIGIGASTGGPQALQQILSALPADFPVPLVCVQHISVGFIQSMVDWLAQSCRLEMRVAGDGELPKPGAVYFSPDGVHLTVDASGHFALGDWPAHDGHRPSISLAFKSLAQCYGPHAAGVLLTGMGHDGVAGMLAIARTGGVTIAQDESTSIVFGMPREAVAADAVGWVLPLPRIATALTELARSGLPPATGALG